MSHLTVSGQTSVAVQFVTERSFGSGLIRWFSHSPFSHVDLVLPSGSMLGARLDGGVAIRPAGYEKWSVIKRVRIATRHADAIYNAALKHEDKPYDTMAIAAFAAPWLFPRRNWRDRDRWICSELVAWAFERTGFFKHVPALPVRRVTPGDVDLLLSPFARVVSAK
jgi:hypothetical protein